MNEWEAALYGLLQGLTEFLPVSSSGHLALYGGLVNGPDKVVPMLYSVLVHVASLLAVLIVFRREVLRLFGQDLRLGVYICLATVPAVAVGLTLGDVIDRVMNRPVPASACLLATGVILVLGEWLARRRSGPGRIEQQMGLGQAMWVGLAQSVALLPGISRSGMTISAGRALGLTRDASVRFAFLLAVPAIAGAGAYETLKLIRHGVAEGVSLGPASAAFVVSLVASWLALIGLIRIIRRFGLWVFSPYCLAIGTAGLIYFV